MTNYNFDRIEWLGSRNSGGLGFIEKKGENSR